MRQNLLQYLGISSLSLGGGLTMGAITVVVGSPIPAIVIGLASIGYGLYLSQVKKDTDHDC